MNNLSPQMKKILLDEFRYSVEKIEKTPDPIQKLFFFSATFGAIQRVFNIEYDTDLVFAHFVLSETYGAFMSRFRALKDNQDTAVPVLVEQIERLTTLVKELAKKVEGDKEITDTLKKFVVLAYTTTGNGYYLYDKGVLKI
jgi:hypothetical protein